MRRKMHKMGNRNWQTPSRLKSKVKSYVFLLKMYIPFFAPMDKSYVKFIYINITSIIIISMQFPVPLVSSAVFLRLPDCIFISILLLCQAHSWQITLKNYLNSNYMILSLMLSKMLPRCVQFSA